MKKPKTTAKIMISGYYGFNNTGDEAILKSMVGAFKEKVPQIKITVLSQSPLQTSQVYKVKAINRLHLIDILRCLRNTDLFISGGRKGLEHIILPGIDIGSKNSQSVGYDLCPGYWSGK